MTQFVASSQLREKKEGEWTMELRVGGKFRLGRKIGSGSFGDIYLGEFWGVVIPVAFVCVSIQREDGS